MKDNDLVTVKVYEKTRANTKKAAALLGLSMVELFDYAIASVIKKELAEINVDWEGIEPSS